MVAPLHKMQTLYELSHCSLLSCYKCLELTIQGFPRLWIQRVHWHSAYHDRNLQYHITLPAPMNTKWFQYLKSWVWYLYTIWDYHHGHLEPLPVFFCFSIFFFFFFFFFFCDVHRISNPGSSIFHASPFYQSLKLCSLSLFFPLMFFCFLFFVLISQWPFSTCFYYT